MGRAPVENVTVCLVQLFSWCHLYLYLFLSLISCDLGAFFQWNENQGFHRNVQTHWTFFILVTNGFNLALQNRNCENCQVCFRSPSYPWATAFILAGPWGRTAVLSESDQLLVSFTLSPSFGPFQPHLSFHPCTVPCLRSLCTRRHPLPSLYSRTSDVCL